MSGRAILYLGGSSYPQDRHVEIALRKRFSRPDDTFLGQEEVCAQQWDFNFRKISLHQIVGRQPAIPIIAIGRSSGGRIVTQAAAEGAALTAIVALGYPFRAPGADDDPGRIDHLADLTVPTLIIQGDNDEYGTAREALQRYQLSSAIRLVEIASDHELALDEARWDAIVVMIEQHIAKAVLRGG